MIHNYTLVVIAYFQSNYGQITDQESSNKKDNLKGTVYDPTAPVDTLFNKIKISK